MFLDRLRQFLYRAERRPIELDLTPYRRVLAQINARGEELRLLGDSRIKEMSNTLIARARAEGKPDNLLVDAYSLAREAARRVLGMRHFDVQVLGGIAMHQGKLVEMQTGEGKTLTAVLPVYLNAMLGRGVHVLTFNDYLARRDAAWMGPVYEALGLTVGYVQEGMDVRDRQRAYRCDITYATAKEVGFDFLRDHVCSERDHLVGRPFSFAIVDEADSILIDEARIPLVIAGTTDEWAPDPYRMAELVRHFRPSVDYGSDENSRNIYPTQSGIDRVEKALGCGSLHTPRNFMLITQLHLALHAQVLLRRDVDYIVRSGKVEIIDEFTGRVVEDRHWPNGLQAAVEAKEGLRIQAEGMVRGSITLIHLAKMYPKLAGMTATAQAAAEEFATFYGLPVVPIPPNQPCVRIDQSDVVFPTKKAKLDALIAEIASVHATGCPILIGTSSVAESDALADELRAKGVTCQVLNAKNDELEAGIVAEAGDLRAVTVSTNMAGRGTDIRLGGRNGQHRAEVMALGGLYVIGTNRHESRRIDDQLRGRAGRQGDPGSSRFFISVQDDLLERFGIDAVLWSQCGLNQQREPIDDPRVGGEIAHVQRVIEGQNLEIRRTLWQYSYVLEHQRRIVHTRRQGLLTGEAAPGLLAKRVSERYRQLAAQFGPEVLDKVERQITLFHIDRCWAEYLDQVAFIREGIHFISGIGGNALDAFHHRVAVAFSQLVTMIDDQIVGTFMSVEITADGIDMAKAGLKGPSSTWTYLINDNPFADYFNRVQRTVAQSGDLVRSLKRALADKSSPDTGS